VTRPVEEFTVATVVLLEENRTLLFVALEGINMMPSVRVPPLSSVTFLEEALKDTPVTLLYAVVETVVVAPDLVVVAFVVGFTVVPFAVLSGIVAYAPSVVVVVLVVVVVRRVVVVVRRVVVVVRRVVVGSVSGSDDSSSEVDSSVDVSGSCVVVSQGSQYVVGTSSSESPLLQPASSAAATKGIIAKAAKRINFFIRIFLPFIFGVFREIPSLEGRPKAGVAPSDDITNPARDQCYFLPCK